MAAVEICHLGSDLKEWIIPRKLSAHVAVFLFLTKDEANTEEHILLKHKCLKTKKG